MKWEEKYDFLLKLFDACDISCIKKNFNTVQSLSGDPSPQIRSLVAKVCSIYESPETLDLLLSLSKDSNKLVRAEAADALCCFEDDPAYQKLIVLCNDPYYMVRGYAEYGIGVVGRKQARKKQAVEIVRGKLKEERFYFNRLQCYMAIYFLGDDDALTEILKAYHLLKYQDKCLVLHFLMEVLTNNNSEMIGSFFSKKTHSESLAVDILVDKLLNQIKENIPPT